VTYPTIDAGLMLEPSTELRYLPESPTCLQLGPLSGQVAWVGIQHGQGSAVGSVNLLDPDNRTNRMLPLPGRPGFVVETDRPETLLVGLDRRLVLFDLRTGATTETGARIEEDPSTMINDGVAAPFGVVFGTKDPAFTDPLGSLYLLRNGASDLVKLRGEQTCSNGKVVIADEDTWQLLDIDTATRQVVRYQIDPDAGELVDRGVVTQLADDDGYPDGMVLTPDGKSVIVAIFNTGEVDHGEARQLSLATGAIEAGWRTPGSPQVTCPLLFMAGSEVKLLLTTANEHMDATKRARHPHAGCLFVAATAFGTPPPPPPLVPLTA
jgi:sugar lactone lactonase YvrE